MQAQARYQNAAGEETILAFKRHILESSAGFAHEPMVDAFRVDLLSKMLDRYDELQEKGMSEFSCRNRVIHEFDDIAVQMHEMGFEEIGAQEKNSSRWPLLTQQEAEAYIRERDVYLHRTSLGVLLCVACLAPMMLFIALAELLYMAEDFLAIFGLMGMFVMIGLGVYTIVTAPKPKGERRIKKGRFSLGSSLRRKLTQMCDALEEKARKRRGRGIALCVMSVIPMFAGAMLTEVTYADAWPLLGVAGMFAMIAVGVYEIIMADGEKKTIGRLLKNKE